MFSFEVKNLKIKNKKTKKIKKVYKTEKVKKLRGSHNLVTSKPLVLSRAKNKKIYLHTLIV